MNGRKQPAITVIGDLILDRYLIGDVTRLNPEQPGVVVRVEKEEQRMGGAAAVAMIAASSGVPVTLIGVLGHDYWGERLADLINTHEIEPHLWFDDRPTTWKMRTVVRGMLRPDRYDHEMTTPITDDAAKFLAEGPLGDMVIMSDYAKGTISPCLLRILRRRLAGSGIPILVDPAHGRNWCDYGVVTLIKANRAEAVAALGCSPDLSAVEMAKRLSRAHDCHVVITLGQDGAVAAERNAETWHHSASRVEVRDVCGAGDTMLAVLALSLLAARPLSDALKAGSAAAARQVTCLGVAAV